MEICSTLISAREVRLLLYENQRQIDAIDSTFEYVKTTIVL